MNEKTTIMRYTLWNNIYLFIIIILCNNKT